MPRTNRLHLFGDLARDCLAERMLALDVEPSVGQHDHPEEHPRLEEAPVQRADARHVMRHRDALDAVVTDEGLEKLARENIAATEAEHRAAFLRQAREVH